jgi:hypothetical protein
MSPHVPSQQQSPAKKLGEMMPILWPSVSGGKGGFVEHILYWHDPGIAEVG